MKLSPYFKVIRRTAAVFLFFIAGVIPAFGQIVQQKDTAAIRIFVDLEMAPELVRDQILDNISVLGEDGSNLMSMEMAISAGDVNELGQAEFNLLIRTKDKMRADAYIERYLQKVEGGDAKVERFKFKDDRHSAIVVTRSSPVAISITSPVYLDTQIADICSPGIDACWDHDSTSAIKIAIDFDRLQFEGKPIVESIERLAVFDLLPPELSDILKKWAGSRHCFLEVDWNPSFAFEGSFHLDSETAADAFAASLSQVSKQITGRQKNKLLAFRPDNLMSLAASIQEPGVIHDGLRKALEEAQIECTKDVVKCAFNIETLTAGVLRQVQQNVDKIAATRNRLITSADGVISYSLRHGHLPTRGDQQSKSQPDDSEESDRNSKGDLDDPIDRNELVSWRGRVLRYVGEMEIWSEVRHTSAWNKKAYELFMQKMPKVFGSSDKGLSDICLVAVATGMNEVEDVQDDLAETIMLVQYAPGISWILPDEPTIDQILGSFLPTASESWIGCVAYDESIIFFSRDFAAEKMRELLQPDDGKSTKIPRALWAN